MTDKCAKCDATGVRLYRSSVGFFRPGLVRCAPCARRESTERNTALHITEIGVYVPLIRSGRPDREPYGYASIPPRDLDAWFDLPETR